ncbi:unnamed protein product [Caenorhabditis sp. 36 PRJEB53466]|nr:unnamed protein product [Caenorhabditis sp. 36 PRJEB53466]
MDGIHIDEMANTQPHNHMPQHFHQKLGKPTDLGQKTPLRAGLGMVINESKTPGAKSLQSIASTRKAPSSTMKNTLPIGGFEIFQDDSYEEEAEPVRKIQPERVCSPIDPCNRWDNHDSLAADIADDMLEWQDDVKLSEASPTGVYIDPAGTEDEELVALEIEDWDEIPPVDTATKFCDDFNYAISAEEFGHCDDAILEEGDYPQLFADFDHMGIDKKDADNWFDDNASEVDDISMEALLEEMKNIPAV